MAKAALVLLLCIALASCTLTLEQPLTDLSASQLPESISVHDEWSGLSPVAPKIIDYTLIHEGDNFTGQVNFSAGGYFGNAYTASENVSIPAKIIQQFLKKLSEAHSKVGEYTPLMQWTDDYPSITLGIKYPAKTFEFMSTSQGDKYVPWKLTIQPGKEYVINSGIPSDALELLKPYLHYEVLDQLIKQAEANQQ